MATVGTAVGPSGQRSETVVVSQVVTASIADFVQFVTLPPGATVTNTTLLFAGTSSSLASVGDKTVAARYIVAASTASDGVLRMNTLNTVTDGAIVNGPGHIYVDGDVVGVTITGAGVTSKRYTLIVEFTRSYGSSASVIRVD